jgi:predicted RND superfamily exporter protein
MKSHTYYRRLAQLVTKHPYTTIGLIVLITVFFGANITRIKIDPDPWKMVPQEDPAVIYWEEVEDLFGRSDAAIVAVISPDTIYTPDTLRKVDELTRRIKEMTVVTKKDIATIDELVEESDGEVKELLVKIQEGGLDRRDIGPLSSILRMLREDPTADGDVIETLEDIKIGLDPFREVMSLSAVENIESIDGVLDTGPVMETIPRTHDECEAIRREVVANDMLVGKIVSEDETSTVVFATLDYTSHEHRTIAIYDGIKEIVTDLGGPEEYYVSGIPMIMSRDASYMKNDMTFLIPLVILVILIILFLVFRNIRGMITPLLVVVISVIWTMGLMAILGIPISIISTALPVLLVAIGCADGIHIITEIYGRLSVGLEKHRAIVDTMEEISSPVIMTSLTTMAGFGSLMTSSLSPIREFGAFAAFGIFAAMVFSLLFIPAMMMILKAPEKLGVAVDRGERITPLVRILDWAAERVIHNKLWVFGLFVPLFIFVIFMTTQIEVGYGFIRDFKKKSEIRIADEKINEKFPGSISFNVVLDSGAPGGAKDPAFLAAVEGLQRHLESDPMVGGSSSLVDFITRMNYVMHDNDPAYNRLPYTEEHVMVEDGDDASDEPSFETVDGTALIAQYLLLYENSGGEDVDKVVDFEYQKVNVVFQLKSSYSRDILDVEREARGYISDHFTDGSSGHLTGTGDLIVVISHYIIKSQLISLATSIIVVFLMLMIVFKSFNAGVYSILPLVFTIFANFAVMRIFGVSLDIATAMIASMGLGIGIDYAIHFVSRYRIERHRGEAVEDALKNTMHSTGRAIIFNAIAVAMGFLVLIFSNFKPIMNVGWLVAVTMMISAAATMIILPALIALFGLNGRFMKGIASIMSLSLTRLKNFMS